MGEMPWFYAVLPPQKLRCLHILSSNPLKDLLLILKKGGGGEGKVLFTVFPLAC